MLSFFKTEREQAGWRFLLLWLITSNIGFFAGLGLEFLIFGQANLYFAVPLSALGQAYAINRHISIYLPWAVGTSIFWWIGIAIAGQIVKLMMTPDTLMTQVTFLATISLIAGLLAAIPQWFFMRDWLPKIGVWWLIANALSSALFFLPGLLAGVILMRFVTADKVPMEGRHYELSGDY